VWDSHGRRYLDLVSGVAVNALGHAHPAVVAAVTAQIQQLGHVSNFFVHEPVLRLAERLQGCSTAPDSHVLFCNSGAEANETAFKIARRTGRPHIVAAQNAFHGRTMGAWRSPASSPSGHRSSRCRRGCRTCPTATSPRWTPRWTVTPAAVGLEPILG
jgi:acetylornithine aminotransferase